MRLREIAPEVYARDILPLTAPLWAGRRNFDVYVEQALETARSGYGRHHYRTIGLFDGATLVASFKRYERSIHDGARQLHAIGFGAVYTPVEFRGRGYASVMLAAELDRARSAGYELAYLFSDIRPHFYRAFGFVELPSRDLTLRAGVLPAQRVQPAALAQGDWNGVRRCFEERERERYAGFVRSESVWGWITMRIKHGSEHAAGHEFNLVVRRGRGIRAYVLGARVPERDAYVVDEYGHGGEDSAALIPALLRAAAGDLRRIVGWLPPTGPRDLVPTGTTRKRKRSIFMMVPLRPDGCRLVDRVLAQRSGDFCWATEHI
jgi:predicted N-acetyltransferase YhbS